MGSLKPGATYIYERDGGIVYSREFGADPTTRKIVGYDLDSSPERKHFSVWNDILKEAETNPTLQKALDRVIMLYKLSKDKLDE
jgi:hypothetical protein